MQKSIVLNDRKVIYELVRKKVKNVNLRIRNGSVYVSARPTEPLEHIERFLQIKAKLILTALDRYAAMEKPSRSFAGGEQISILGHMRTICVREGTFNEAFLGTDNIYLTVKEPENEELRKKTVDKFIRQLSEKLMTRLCGEIWASYTLMVKQLPEIRVRKMKSRWGSCNSTKGILTFNIALVHAPLSCICYVIHHEFCHFIHADHSKAFYSVLERRVPDWKQQRETLATYNVYLN